MHSEPPYKVEVSDVSFTLLTAAPPRKEVLVFTR